MPEILDQNQKAKLFSKDKRTDYLPWILMALALGVMVFLLWTNGRIWWCKWDTPIYIATLDAWSKHTSQHFFDPYALTHVLHGFLFLWILSLIVHKIFDKKLSFAWLLFFAVFTEAAWEVVENSQYVIEKYREQTASLEYTGDSIANSFGDILACAFGFVIAYRLKFWLTFLLFVIIEIILLVTIRDNLTINIIMLIYPIEAIKAWQTNAQETAQLLYILFGKT